MAIKGYEVDIVRRDSRGQDHSVPSYEQYNHHYTAYMYGNNSQLMYNEVPSYTNGHPSHYRLITQPGDYRFPQSQFFSEGNGNEMRKSYKYMPRDTAQLIESPTVFAPNPMIINTRSPDPADPRGGPLPRESKAPPGADYSGILECPCTDRVVKDFDGFETINQGACQVTVANASSCFAGAVQLGLHAVQNRTLRNASLPSGCSVSTSKAGVVVTFNDVTARSVPCGSQAPPQHALGTVRSLVHMSVDINNLTNVVTINLTGNASVWFGVGFNAQAMADEPYTIIVDGYGNVTERRLANHAPGDQIQTSVTVLGNTVRDNRRTVVLQRPIKGLTPQHYTFELTTAIPIINAYGNGPVFDCHKDKASAVLPLLDVNGHTCMCQGRGGRINGIKFPESCVGQLVEEKNPTCNLTTYQGGMSCCRHGYILLDKDQNPPQEPDNFYVKYRFYYEDYQPSHQNALRVYWMTETFHSEYDVPKAPPGTPSSMAIHSIQSEFTLREALERFVNYSSIRNATEITDPRCVNITKAEQAGGLKLVYAAAHCHAPACISLELYRKSTGELICRNTPVYGQSDNAMDERGYVVGIPPCVWSDKDDSLQNSPLLTMDEPLFQIKKVNSTNAHIGVMAMFQCRAVYADGST
eukprot:TRINITY_DN6208_c0_g1_i3.p1 TRINITY_DN6208_c0_g1~~TRINITY_DN6208_c0_g1_i3.p1  ORF type:complete len:722 (+),score=149.90 TRINITY_DN6208_c0_g1_i3:253-2166(+)